MKALLRSTRRDFRDWRRREPVWSLWCLGVAVFFAVQGVLRLAVGGDEWFTWLSIALMYGAYIGAKLEVSNRTRVAFRAGQLSAYRSTSEAFGLKGRISFTDTRTGETTVHDLPGGAR